jgi:hypothetical protein
MVSASPVGRGKGGHNSSFLPLQLLEQMMGAFSVMAVLPRRRLLAQVRHVGWKDTLRGLAPSLVFANRPTMHVAGCCLR